MCNYNGRPLSRMHSPVDPNRALRRVRNRIAYFYSTNRAAFMGSADGKGLKHIDHNMIFTPFEPNLGHIRILQLYVVHPLHHLVVRVIIP